MGFFFLPYACSLHWTYCGKERHFPDASARRWAVFGEVTKARVWYLQVIFQQSSGHVRAGEHVTEELAQAK